LVKASGHTEHYERVKAKAIRAAETIRRFAAQLDSVLVKAEIYRRLESLDDLLSKL
jgi:hypothetical protein